MGGVFGGGRKGSIGPKRLDGASLQSSVYGNCIPIGWGTNRLSINFLQLENFRATAKKERVGGKGGGSVTQVTYTYSAAVLLALGQDGAGSTVAGIPRIWRDKSVFTNGKTTALAQAGLSLANGAFAQSAWSYITTNYPSRALGYSRLAYLYASAYPLGETGGLNNHSAEVQWSERVSGLPDAQPANVVEQTLENIVPGWPSGKVGDLSNYGDYCLAANLLLSPLIDASIPAAQFLADVFRATNSDCIWSEGVLKVIPYGDKAITGNGVTWTPDLTPIYDLDEDDFTESDKPVELDLVDQSDAYNIAQVEFINRNNSYNIETVSAQDLANIELYGRRKQDPLNLHMIADPDVARNVVQLYLQRVLYVRGKYRFELPWDYALLEPMDLVTISCPAPMSLDRVLVRLTEIIDDDAESGMGRKCEAEPMLVGTANAPLYGNQQNEGYTPNYDVDPGDVESNLFVWSQQFDKAEWPKIELGVTAEATTAPDGTTTAEKLTPTTATDTHNLYQLRDVIVDRTQVLSVYLKTAGYSKVNLRVGDHTNGANLFVDCSAGTITGDSEFGTGVLEASGVESVGSGWYHFWMAVTVPSASALYCDFYLLSAGGADVWAGNGTDGVYAWGAMFRPGESLMTYTPTGGVPAVPYLFNPPSVLTLTGRETWAAVAGQDQNWGGCNVWVSVDGTNYLQVGTIDGRSRYGIMTNELPITTDPDTSSALGVNLTASLGELEDATNDDADALTTLFLLGEELLAYGSASLLDPYQYGLEYLRRGALKSTIAAHIIGDAFVRLDDRVFKFPYLTSVQGTTLYAKFQSYNVFGQAVRDLSECFAYPFEPSPVLPPAPISTDWSVSGTTFVFGTSAIPALVIEGACSNPDATQLQFYFRVNGAGSYTAAGGAVSRDVTRHEITGVTQNTPYDTAVSEFVGGQWGPVRFIGTATSGTFSTGGPPLLAGTILLDDHNPGSRTFVVPPGLASDLIVQRWGPGGSGGGQTNIGDEKEPDYVPNYGGGGGEYVEDTIPASSGDEFDYTVGGYGGEDTEFESLSDAHAGGGGSDLAPGAGGTGGSGDVQDDGSPGGSPDAWSGGAPGNEPDSGGYGYGGAGGPDGTPVVGRVKITVA